MVRADGSCGAMCARVFIFGGCWMCATVERSGNGDDGRRGGAWEWW